MDKTTRMSAARFREIYNSGGFDGATATESEEQQKLFAVINACKGAIPELCMACHVPNEGKRSASGGGRAVAEGLTKGVPDIFLDAPKMGFHGLRIELKRKKKYKISDAQAEWIDNLLKRGYAAAFCFGWEEAWEFIHAYITENRDIADKYIKRRCLA